jgi:hypothetical protein
LGRVEGGVFEDIVKRREETVYYIILSLLEVI